jgi:hypothetical protein
LSQAAQLSALLAQLSALLALAAQRWEPRRSASRGHRA